MIFTSKSTLAYQRIIREHKTLKAQVLACLRFSGHTSFELEEGLNHLHQSVSSTLTRLEQDGAIECLSYRDNQYGNSCRVYTIVQPKTFNMTFKVV